MGQSAGSSEAPTYILGECFDEEIGDHGLITMTGAEYKAMLAIFERQQEEMQALEYRIKTLLES